MQAGHHSHDQSQNPDQQTSPEALNQKFEKEGITFGTGLGDLTTVNISHKDQALVLYLEGAHITSWSGKKTGEHLFVSEESAFEAGKPIRGGIPICYPQFGDFGDLALHGFARTSPWKPLATASYDSAKAIVLELNDSEGKLWPGNPTRANLTIELSNSLLMSLEVENLGAKPIEITNAFHTYFRIGDITTAQVQGLDGLTYLDRVGEPQKHTENDKEIKIVSETDRIYANAPEEMSVSDPTRGLKFVVRKDGQNDAVLWNPWIDKSARMPDFGNREYTDMLCLETGNMAKPIQIQPGRENMKRLAQVLEVLSL